MKFIVSISIADPDPGSGAFLTLYPGSRILNPFFDSLMTSKKHGNVSLNVLAKKFSLPVQKLNYLQFCDICGRVYKKK
jgi:hypothetical protein